MEGQIQTHIRIVLKENVYSIDSGVVWNVLSQERKNSDKCQQASVRVMQTI